MGKCVSGGILMKKETRMDCSVEAVQGLLIDAHNNYEKSLQLRHNESRYWDGYIQACRHILEMNDE